MTEKEKCEQVGRIVIDLEAAKTLLREEEALDLNERKSSGKLPTAAVEGRVDVTLLPEQNPPARTTRDEAALKVQQLAAKLRKLGITQIT